MFCNYLNYSMAYTVKTYYLGPNGEKMNYKLFFKGNLIAL